MSEKMSKVHYIELGVYPIHVGITDNEAAYKKEVKRLCTENPGDFVKPNCAATVHLLIDANMKGDPPNNVRHCS